MKGSQRKIISRIIAKVYHLTKNETLKLALINLTTKIFVDWKNEIEYDSTNELFWLKSGKEYLLAVEKPYFDFHRKYFEQRGLEIFCQNYLPQKGDIIINVGAGIGEELFFFQGKIMPYGKLYNIEASPASFQKLEILCKKNNYLNCANFNFAISDRNGEQWIEETIDYYKNKTNRNAIGTKVLCYSFDQFVVDNKIYEINYLKVNIEGAEFHMIDGMKDSINSIENIAISCHDFLSKKNDNIIMNKVKDFLTTNNFEVFQRKTGSEILDSWVYGKRQREKTNLL